MLRLRVSQLLAASAVAYSVVTLGFAHSARADVLPMNDCDQPGESDAGPGQPCTTAGPDFDQDGVCTTENHPCSNEFPDSGTCTWVLCELADAGTPTKVDSGTTKDSGTPSTKDSGTATAKDAAGPVTTAKDSGTAAADAGTQLASSGCSVSATHGGSGWDGACFLGFGLAGLALSRRRRA